MAELKVDGNDVVVCLSGVEALAACRREVRVPLRCLRMVHVEGTPLVGVSVLRLPGLSWPGAFVFGSRRRRGRREFVAARAGLPAVVLEADGADWDRVVVSLPNAVDIAAELAALLLGRGPSNRGHGGHGDHGNGSGDGDRDRRRRGRRNGRSGLTLERAGIRARVGRELGPVPAPVPAPRHRPSPICLPTSLLPDGLGCLEPALEGETFSVKVGRRGESASNDRFWVQQPLLVAIAGEIGA
jgi:hypothetical protein